MQAKDPFDPWFVQCAFVTHSTSARSAFFGGLKEEFDGAGYFGLVVFEYSRRSEQHGRVTVVPTSVHFAVDFAAEGDVGFFLDRQGVHVSSQRDAASVAVADRGEHSGLGDWVAVGDAEFVEGVADELAGANLFVHQLWMLMQRATTLDDPVADRLGLLKDLVCFHAIANRCQDSQIEIDILLLQNQNTKTTPCTKRRIPVPEVGKLHVFAGSFGSREDARRYTEQQWGPQPPDDASEEEHIAREGGVGIW